MPLPALVKLPTIAHLQMLVLSGGVMPSLDEVEKGNTDTVVQTGKPCALHFFVVNFSMGACVRACMPACLRAKRWSK